MQQAHSISLIQPLAATQLVLLKLGFSDDALRCYAVMTPLSHDVWTVKFHAKSLILDRLRLFGQTTVHIVYAGLTFSAVIKPSFKQDETLAVIECLKPCLHDAFVQQPLTPRT